MSFSSLPPELVHHIIESSVPHSFHSVTYRERQRTLCALSLVSRLFRSIAQPLLFEIIKLEQNADVEKLNVAKTGNDRTGARSLTRWVVVDDWFSSTEERINLGPTLQTYSALDTLTLMSIHQESTNQILKASSNTLTSLHLSHLSWSSPVPILLPHLQDLTLSTPLSPELCLAFVDPKAVPNLRNFAFVTGNPSCAEYLAPSKLEQLIPQLETLTLSAPLWLDPRATFLHPAASRTLVDFKSTDAQHLDVSTARPTHVRLWDSPSLYLNYYRMQAQLDQWSSLIKENLSPSLKSIYLDSATQRNASFSTACQISLEALVRACREHKIDVVFERSPWYRSLDPCISSEFVQRQKEQRRIESSSQR
ncbi:hypothetical protein JCM3765_000269 [Sporobolomyces pararoseus]